MSKDKGQKNQKKSPADQSSGKLKVGSSYKNEGKVDKDNVICKKADSFPLLYLILNSRLND